MEQTKKFGKTGARVILKANPQEGWEEERGRLVSDEVENDTVMVRVDKKYRSPGDDGLREASLDQVSLVA